MTSPVVEQLSGTSDGVNKIFRTSRLYKAGSVVTYLNGLAKVPGNEDGCVELGNRRVEMKEAPQTADIVFAYYIPL